MVTADCSWGAFFGSSGCFLALGGMGGFGDTSEGEPVMTGSGCCGRVCGGCLVTADCSWGAFFGSSGCFLALGGMGGFRDTSKGEPVMTGSGCCGCVCGLSVADSCVRGWRVDCFLLVLGRCLVGGGTFFLCSGFFGNVR